MHYSLSIPCTCYVAIGPITTNCWCIPVLRRLINLLDMICQGIWHTSNIYQTNGGTAAEVLNHRSRSSVTWQQRKVRCQKIGWSHYLWMRLFWLSNLEINSLIVQPVLSLPTAIHVISFMSKLILSLFLKLIKYPQDHSFVESIIMTTRLLEKRSN